MKGKLFEFDYILYMCKSCKMDMSAVKKKKNKNPSEENKDFMFINAEDELLCQVGECFELSLLELSDSF